MSQKVTGAVFQNPSDWTDGNYGAPKAAHFESTSFIYYSVKKKETAQMCVGVGTAQNPDGLYLDRGSMVCEDVGSIDPYPVEDASGAKHLFWKEEGSSQKKINSDSCAEAF